MRQVRGMVAGAWCLGVLQACGGGPTTAPPPVPLASSKHFSVVCARHGVAAFDSARELLPSRPLDCWAEVGDVTGAPIEGATVRFYVEAGQAAAVAVTDASGRASLGYQTGLPLPLDVEPGAWTPTPVDDGLNTGVLLAPSWMEPDHWVENPPALGLKPPSERVYTRREPRRPDPIRLLADGSGRPLNNPRDNLVTLMATVAGAEDFTDLDGDGAYMRGEPVVDQAEPFVDRDDDGTWDPGEAFVDVDMNRKWDPPNGKRDLERPLWTQERILWTGQPAAEDRQPVLVGIPGHRPTAIEVVSGLEFTCQQLEADGGCLEATPLAGRPDSFVGYIADPWFNTPAEPMACGAASLHTPSLVELGAVVSSLDGGTLPAGFFVSTTVTDARDLAGPVRLRQLPGVPFSWSVSCRSVAAGNWAPVSIDLFLTGTIE